MSVKKHLQGGSLRMVMVNEIKRCVEKWQDHHSPTLAAAMELGISPKTLRLWKGPVDKGGWEELQGYGGMDMLLSNIKRK